MMASRQQDLLELDGGTVEQGSQSQECVGLRRAVTTPCFAGQQSSEEV